MPSPRTPGRRRIRSAYNTGPTTVGVERAPGSWAFDPACRPCPGGRTRAWSRRTRTARGPTHFPNLRSQAGKTRSPPRMAWHSRIRSVSPARRASGRPAAIAQRVRSRGGPVPVGTAPLPASRWRGAQESAETNPHHAGERGRRGNGDGNNFGSFAGRREVTGLQECPNGPKCRGCDWTTPSPVQQFPGGIGTLG